MADTSVWSFKDRGKWGSAKWRGNCSGYVIKTLLQYYKPALFVDPAEGSGTSGKVAKEMGVRYVGLDLHKGFNLLKDSLILRVGRPADLIFFHPPYHDMITYSGNMWGSQPHPDDLSRCTSVEEFIEKLRTALMNIYEALEINGVYSVLIGDMRRKGAYYSFQSDIIQIAPGILEGIIIKTQHNCISDSRVYAHNDFIPIMHEYLLNFRKDRFFVGMLDCALKTSHKLVSLSNATWKSVVSWALQKCGGKANLDDLYGVIAQEAQEKMIANPHWQAKVRQVLQKTAINVERGVWALKAA
jgi:hypothetical protein